VEKFLKPESKNGAEHTPIALADGKTPAAHQTPPTPAPAPAPAADPSTTVVMQMTIKVFASGDVNVEGPLDQSLYCYGMLEQAKDLVRSYSEQQRRQSMAKKPRIALPKFVKGFLNRSGAKLS
jgi:hypothetical protein